MTPRRSRENGRDQGSRPPGRCRNNESPREVRDSCAPVVDHIVPRNHCASDDLSNLEASYAYRKEAASPNCSAASALSPTKATRANAHGDPLAAGAGDPGGLDAGDGVGGLASSQGTPERSLPAMDVSSETLICRLRQHAPVWSERFGVQSLRVFGSWARGTATPSSDVDLLVAFDGPATARRFYGLQLFLEDLLQQPVDLVTEQALREELRPAVEADAITL